MTFLDRLPTLADQRAVRKAVPKGLPRPIVQAEKKQSKEAQAAAFRRAVWIRDHARSRASGTPLQKSGVEATRVGEVHHVYARSTDPDKRYDVRNGILLSRAEHQLAETACPGDPRLRLLEIVGPTDRGEPQTFIWRNVDGTVKRKMSG